MIAREQKAAQRRTIAGDFTTGMQFTPTSFGRVPPALATSAPALKATLTAQSGQSGVRRSPGAGEGSPETAAPRARTRTRTRTRTRRAPATVIRATSSVPQRLQARAAPRLDRIAVDVDTLMSDAAPLQLGGGRPVPRSPSKDAETERWLAELAAKEAAAAAVAQPDFAQAFEVPGVEARTDVTPSRDRDRKAGKQRQTQRPSTASPTAGGRARARAERRRRAGSPMARRAPLSPAAILAAAQQLDEASADISFRSDRVGHGLVSLRSLDSGDCQSPEEAAGFKAGSASVPATLIPESHHFIQTMPAIPTEAAAGEMTGKTGAAPGGSSSDWQFDQATRLWFRTVFPNAQPSGRREVKLLEQWLAGTLVKSQERAETARQVVEQAQALYSVGFHELMRQVSVHCVERGHLMAKIWHAYLALFERLLRLNETEVDALRREYEFEIRALRANILHEQHEMKNAQRKWAEERADMIEEHRAGMEELEELREIRQTRNGEIQRLREILQELVAQQKLQAELDSGGARNDPFAHKPQLAHDVMVALGRAPPEIPLSSVPLNVGGAHFEVDAEVLIRRDRLASRFFNDVFFLDESAQAAAAAVAHAKGTQYRPGKLVKGRFRATTEQGADGAFFIDRDGAMFEIIANFLRNNGELSCPLTRQVLKDLRLEADFYEMPALNEALTAKFDELALLEERQRVADEKVHQAILEAQRIERQARQKLEEFSRAAQSTEASLTGTIKGLESDKRTLDRRIVRMTTELETVKKENSVLRVDIDKLQTDFRAVQNELNDLQSDSRHTDELKELVDRIVDLETQVVTEVQGRETAVKDLVRANKEVVTAKGEIARLTEEITVAQQELSETRGELDALQPSSAMAGVRDADGALVAMSRGTQTNSAPDLDQRGDRDKARAEVARGRGRRRQSADADEPQRPQYTVSERSPPQWANLMPKRAAKAEAHVTSLRRCKQVLLDCLIEKLKADSLARRDGGTAPSPAGFAVEYFMARYGVKRLVQTRVRELHACVRAYANADARVAFFGRSVGMVDPPLPAAAVEFYLTALRVLVAEEIKALATGRTWDEVESDTWVPLRDAVKAARAVFSHFRDALRRDVVAATEALEQRQFESGVRSEMSVNLDAFMDVVVGAWERERARVEATAEAAFAELTATGPDAAPATLEQLRGAVARTGARLSDVAVEAFFAALGDATPRDFVDFCRRGTALDPASAVAAAPQAEAALADERAAVLGARFMDVQEELALVRRTWDELQADVEEHIRSKHQTVQMRVLLEKRRDELGAKLDAIESAGAVSEEALAEALQQFQEMMTTVQDAVQTERRRSALFLQKAAKETGTNRAKALFKAVTRMQMLAASVKKKKREEAAAAGVAPDEGEGPPGEGELEAVAEEKD